MSRPATARGLLGAVCALAALMVVLSAPAAAHVASPAVGQLELGDERATYRLTMLPADLGAASAPFVRGAAGDAGEAQRAIAQLQQHLELALDSRLCRVSRARLQGVGEALTVTLDWRCPPNGAELRWQDSTAWLFGEHHRTITSIVRPGGGPDAVRGEHVFDRDITAVTLELRKPSDAGLGSFVALGFRHILEGLDHLLFLAALLLGRRDLSGLLLTVTTFTAAHSASLAASALGVANVPADWVEPVVAASVIWASLANLSPRPARLEREVVTFAFGLVHGLAFSEALVPLGLGGWSLARALLGFNVGVELAQAVLVAACVPLIHLAAGLMPRRRFEVLASLAIALVGTAWLIERLSQT